MNKEPYTFVEVSPCNKTKDYIQDLAGRLSIHYGYAAGVDIKELIREKLGGKISHTDASGLASDQHGSIEVYGPGNFCIQLSPFIGAARNRFTIGHELGHYFLHSLAGQKPIKVFRRGYDRAEKEANWFAAGFLMPQDLFHQAWAAKAGNVYEVADHFRLSTGATEIRADELGLKKAS